MGRIIENATKNVTERTDHKEAQQDEAQLSLILLLWMLSLLFGFLAVTVFVWFKIRAGQRRRYSQISDRNTGHSSLLMFCSSTQQLCTNEDDQPTEQNKMGTKSSRIATAKKILNTFKGDRLKKSSNCRKGAKSNNEKPVVVRATSCLYPKKKLNVPYDYKYGSLDDSYTELTQLSGRKLSEDSRPEMFRGAFSSDSNQSPPKNVLGKRSLTFRATGSSKISPGATGHPSFFRSVSDKWIQYTQQTSERGRLYFSLSYNCTVKLLEITINRLSGLRPVESSEQCLFGRTQSAFVVDVKLRRTVDCLDSQKPVERLSLKRTQPAFGTFNSVFDQTVKFDLNVQDICSHELILTIYRTAVQEDVDNTLNNRRRSITRSLSFKRENPLSLSGLENPICIGAVHYQLSKDALLNNPAQLQGISKELQFPPESDAVSAEKSENRKEPSSESLGQQTSSSCVTNSTSVTESTRSKGEKPAIEISIVYKTKDSTLLVSLCGVKNLKTRSTDDCVFIRTMLYKGGKILATYRSQSVAIPSHPIQRQFKAGKDKHAGAKIEMITLVSPPSVIAQFPITVSKILKNESLGLVLYVCSQSWFGKSRILGHCATGGSSFSRNEITHHWQEFIDLLRATQELEQGEIASTQPIACWHSLT